MVSTQTRARRFSGRARIRVLALLVATLVLELTFSAEVSLAGVHPDLMLLLAVAAGLVGGEERGAIVGFGAGLAADLFLQLPFGLSALTLALVGYAVGTLREALLRASAWLAALVAVLASAGGEVLYAIIGAIVGQGQMLNDRLGPIVGVVAGVNGLAVLVMMPAMRWALSLDATPRSRRGRW